MEKGDKMAVVVGEVRITYVFSSTLPALANEVPADAPLPGILSPLDYARAFRGATGTGADPVGRGPWPVVEEGSTPFALPWSIRPEDRFNTNNYWKYSLGTRDYHDSSVGRAWRVQAWLRSARRIRLETSDTRVRAVVDVGCHPLADSVVISLRCTGDGTLSEWAQRCADLDRDLLLTTSDGEAPRTIRRLGYDLLDRLARARLGDTERGLGYAPDPAIITTVVRAGGGVDECAAVEGGEVHKFLACVAERATFDALPQPVGLADHLVLSRAERAGGAMFAAGRQRVVWAPNRFRAGGRGRWLGCYHNNLAVLTAHVDAWIGTIRWAAVKLRAGVPITRGVEAVDRTSRLLMLLYTSDRRSHLLYRSRSAAAQILVAGAQSELLEVLRYVGVTEPVSVIPIFIGEGEGSIT
ncbi:hypothetical protein ABTZ99_19730 [Actinosynnema sp. NPDC002837]